MNSLEFLHGLLHFPQDSYCSFDPLSVGATCYGYVDITGGDEHNLKKVVAIVGPISVAIDASNLSFQFYKSGIYISRQCTPE